METLTLQSTLMPAAQALVNANPFATIISLNNDAKVVHLPLLYDAQAQCFYGHSARNNRLLQSLKADTKANVKLVFTGAHGYVSPTWHQDIKVPTWDYAVVHVSGRLEQVGEQQKQAILAKQVSTYESHWQLDGINEDGLNEKMKTQMLKAITVFTITADNWQAKFKLSQNKSADAKAAILQQMEAQNRHDMVATYANLRQS